MPDFPLQKMQERYRFMEAQYRAHSRRLMNLFLFDPCKVYNRVPRVASSPLNFKPDRLMLRAPVPATVRVPNLIQMSISPPFLALYYLACDMPTCCNLF